MVGKGERTYCCDRCLGCGPITPQYLNIEQASAYLSITTWTIRRLIDNKELSCAKIGKRFIVKREERDKVWEKKAAA
jgi:excisionase family DNA binding protein